MRDHLDEHRATFGATTELTAAKHQVRDWVESRLAGVKEPADVRLFAETLHTALAGAGLLCNDLNDECDWNFLGYVDDVRVSRAGEFLVVVTAMGIWCGYDESAYVYAWEGRAVAAGVGARTERPTPNRTTCRRRFTMSRYRLQTRAGAAWS